MHRQGDWLAIRHEKTTYELAVINLEPDDALTLVTARVQDATTPRLYLDRCRSDATAPSKSFTATVSHALAVLAFGKTSQVHTDLEVDLLPSEAALAAQERRLAAEAAAKAAEAAAAEAAAAAGRAQALLEAEAQAAREALPPEAEAGGTGKARPVALLVRLPSGAQVRPIYEPLNSHIDEEGVIDGACSTLPCSLLSSPSSPFGFPVGVACGRKGSQLSHLAGLSDVFPFFRRRGASEWAPTPSLRSLPGAAAWPRWQRWACAPRAWRWS